MRVLGFVFYPKLDSLVQNLVDYLIDAGHSIFIPSTNSASNLEWKSRFKHNLHIFDKEQLNQQEIDYLVDFNNQGSNSKNVPQIYFNLRLVGDEFFITSFLKKSNSSAIICINNNKLSQLSALTLPECINNLVNEVTEIFIDSVIYLSRFGEEHLAFQTDLAEDSDAIDLTEYISTLEALNDPNNASEDESEVFLIENLITASHENVDYSEQRISLEDKNARFNDTDLEILSLYLVTLFNSRQNKIYTYNFYYKDTDSFNVKLTKFINLRVSDSYRSLLNKCNNSMYSIGNNAFYSDPTLNNCEINSSISVSYDCQNVDSTYTLLIYYNSNLNELGIRYKKNLLFFNDFERYIDIFLNGFKQFKANKANFYQLLASSQDYLKLQLSSWHKEDRQCHDNKTVPYLFEEQAKRTPGNIAVIYDNVKLTYKELNKKSNQLANYLRQIHNIKPDTLVALFLNKSEYMLVAILAVLKAGGAYVPIDPHSPDARIKSILNGIKVILTNEIHQERLKEISVASKLNILAIDNHVFREQLSLQLTTNPKSSLTSDNLAYVVYTSGTTGVPKGVMIHHSGILNLSMMQGREFGLASTKDITNCLWYTNYVFDAHVSEVYTSILNGHTVHIIDGDIRHNLVQLNNYIKTSNIAIATIPPALLNNKVLLELDLLVVAGEKTNREILEKYRSNNIKLINAYGPSETTVCASLNHYCDNGATNIGSPIPNIKCYVLDDKLNLLPIGVIGELYIGGAGLARGYLNKPDFTAEKFIANPFQSKEERSKNKNWRLYRTGDLVRWSADGSLEYIGRNDFQVKIRGYRIELGEIESVLTSYNGISQGAVVSKERIGLDNIIDKYLVGYYVAEDKLEEEEILSYLRSKLPEYMVPTALISLSNLPLTVNGKLDRTALPDLELTNLNSCYVEPRDESEVKIRSIWAEALGLSETKISIYDDFFKLGGNSISAIRMVSKLNSQFKSDIKISDIFYLKTIEKVSNIIKRSIGSFVYKDYIITESDEITLFEPFPLTNVQQAYYLGRVSNFELGNISTHVYSEYKFKHFNIQSLEMSFNQLLKRHLVLRTIFSNNQQQYLKDFPYYRIELHELSSEKELLAIRNKLSHKVYSPEIYPLFDILVSKLRDSYILHISFDALIIDMSSFQILAEEWTKFYVDTDLTLPLLKVSYRDYIIKSEEIRASELYQKAKKYWVNKIDNYNFDFGLPLLTSTVNIKEPRFARVSRVIKSDTWNKLLHKIQKLSISSTILILEIYGKVLAFWSNQNKICINLTLFNRLPLHPQINEIVGDFTILELFNYIDNQNQKINEKLKTTHANLWEDIEHNLFDGIDFQRLIKNQKSISADQIIAPIVLTSALSAASAHQRKNVFDLPIDSSYQGINYSITQTSQVWLDNKVYEVEEGLVIEWEYVEQLFSKEVIQAMHDSYCILIKDLAEANWDKESLPNITVPKKDKKLIELTNSHKQEVKDDTLFSRYEHLVVQKSLYSNTAVVDDSTAKNYSYKELLEDSDLLSKYIFLKTNIQLLHDAESDSLQGKLIAILSDKGYNHVVAPLSIMKSGHGYLPLNTSWPMGRLEEVLLEAKVSVVLISKAQYNKREIRESLSTRYQLFIIEDILLAIHADEKLKLEYAKVTLPEVSTDEVAYVIFTSGSTGKPKGVTILHRGAVNTIDAVNAKFSVSCTDKVLALSELSFDLSVYDIFGILSVGGTVIFPEQSKIQSSRYWLDLINKHQITIWNTVPQLASLLIEELANRNLYLSCFKLFLLSGDWIPTSLPEEIKKYCCRPIIVSLGGATEGSIWSIWYEIKKVKKEWNSIPYGVAMPNQEIHILNYYNEHCPVAVRGEIYIGGIGVALNYWGDTELTNDSFIDHNTLGKLYKTGDLGRWHKDGYVEFVGRKDNQVKLNGYRVELEEISAKLKKLNNIKEAVVTVQKQNDKDYIVGYLLPQNYDRKRSHGFTNAESFSLSLINKQGKYSPNDIIDLKLIKKIINLNLSKFLPDYMLPSSYVILEKLPITANGKIEFSKLPKLCIEEVTNYVAPRNNLESKICKIWSGILGIPKTKISIDDNLFGLGGNSITAIRLVSKLNKELDNNISIDTFFRHDSIKKLADYLTHNTSNDIVIDRIFVLKIEEQLLSYGQERLWFIENYEEGTNAYNLPLVFKQCAGVEVDILEKSIRGIISRHEILRTLIKTDNEGNRYQLVLKDNLLQLEISRIKVTSQSELNRELNILVNHIYDLTNEPPIKVCMYEISDHGENTNGSEYYLGIVVHHIAFDGWSIEIFLNELAAFYNYFLKLSTGAEARLDLPELSIQYKDFALWQRSYLSGEKLEKQLDYWQSKIEGYEALNIATDMPRPRQIDYSGEDIYFELDEARSNSLRELAKELKVSLYSLLLAGYYLMLRAYSQQDDIVIGTPVANRHYNNVENLIGFFVNSLALRVQIDSNLSLVEFIQYVSHEVMEAQLHQDLPFEKLVEKLNLAKDTSRHPIFQVMFGVHDFGSKIHNKKSNSGEVGLNDILEIYATKDSVVKAAQFDISTFIDDSHVTLKGSFNYATKIYTRVTIENLIATYTEILGQFVELTHDFQRQANTKIRDLRHLSKEQYKKVIVDWNRTAQKYPADKTIQSLFDDQVKLYPNNIALVYQNTKLTYAQLSNSANQLANYIRSNHLITHDTLIALCFDKSELMIIAILAVLKAGGAYVPLDPTYPDTRIRYILDDTATKLVLTNELHLQRLLGIKAICLHDEKASHPMEVLSIDNNLIQTKILSQSLTAPMISTKSSDLAYVIYTSGTAGKPKGVMVEHTGIINLKYSIVKIYELGNQAEQESILLFANYVFDTSVEQIILSLLGGNKLILIPDHLWQNQDEFYKYLHVNQVTHLEASPTFLQQYDFNKVPSLKRLIFGGEQLSQELYSKMMLCNNYKIINSYGLTETSITSIINTSQNNARPDIGIPIDNTTCYVLDKQLNPIPIGAIGELYIGGVGLARGYLNRPDLTAEKFIASPFSSKKGGKFDHDRRIYKTGDLARWLPDGNLEYIGRNDFQIKIRGHRIELTEIESILLNYPGINQVVVLAKESRNEGGDTKYLVAYYLSPSRLNQEGIIDYLQMRLPEYMVPRAFVYLRSFPLTINGKLNRSALPEPRLANIYSYVAPRNEIELKACQIWSEVLAIPKDKIGINDDFFKLGGDSIVSIQLVGRLRQSLNLDITVKDIFAFKTISRLYDNLFSKSLGNKNDLSIKTEQGILGGEVSLLPVQEWFFQSDFVVPNHWNQSFLLKTPNLDLAKLQKSLEKLVKHHDNFRLRYKNTTNLGVINHEKVTTNSSNYIQYYDTNANLEELQILDLKTLGVKEGTKEFNIILQDILTKWQTGFNLEKGPIYSFGYIHGYADGSSRIYFALHHLIVDTVSWRIIAEDLKGLYHGKDLTVKGSSYRQWVNTVKTYENIHSHERDYWDNVLFGYSSINNSKLAELVGNGGVQNSANISLSRKETEKLLRESNITYNTQVNDILLTALSYVLSEITGSKVNYIVLEGHGREPIDSSIDISRTVGWFTTMYPIRLEVKDSLDGTIKNTKEILRKIPNAGIGYGALIKYQAEDLPKVSFNYLGQFNTEEDTTGQGLWTIISDVSGESINSLNCDHNIIDMNGMIINCQLQFTISTKLDKSITGIVAQGFKQRLVEVINYTAIHPRSYLTPSDVGNVVGQRYLDKLQKIREIEGVYLCNSLQQGFIYHYLNQGHSDSAYRGQLIWKYSNKLDIEKIKKAWKYAQKRFSSLRLRFSWEEELVQIIDKEVELNWRYIDLSGEDNVAVQESKITQIQEDDRQELYDLEQGSLFKIYIIKQRENLYCCIFSSHHIILDGWSNSILIAYVHDTYLKLNNREVITLSTDSSYEIAHKYLQENQNEHQGYWNEYVLQIERKNDLSGLLSIASRNKQIKIGQYKHIKYTSISSFTVRDALYDKLKQVCQDEGLTLNAIIQYVWHKTLSAFSNSNQTVVGTTVSGRNLPINNIETSVGLYINTLPLIVNHNNHAQNVVQAIKSIQDNINEMNIRSNVNLTTLQKDGERLFDTLFVYENYPGITKNEKQSGINIISESWVETLDYPLVVTAYELNKALTVKLQYANEIFDNKSIQILLSVIQILIKQISDNPKQKVAELSYLDEEQQIITVDSTEQKVNSTNKIINKLFEEQVARTPQNIAIITQSKLLTYEDLNNQANRLANYLINDRIIRPDGLVALFLDRSEYMTTSILAVLKAGGVFIPIDPSYPDHRIAYILEDTKTEVILTNESYQKRLENIIKTTNSDTTRLNIDPKKSPNILTIDSRLLEEQLLLQPVTNPQPLITSDNLVYVIYTSGTTGNPKGVMITHKAYVETLVNVKDLYFKNKTRISTYSTTNYTFDIFGLELGLPLLTGGTISIGTKDYNSLDCSMFDFIQMTPSLCELKLPCLKNTLSTKLFVGGENLNYNLLNSLLNKFLCVINLYGPTETTIWSTSRSYIENQNLYVSIGKPFNNERVYVLDSKLNLLPVGAIGELYIGGIGLARGYLNRPDLTAEKFIANPFTTEGEKIQYKNSRLYKTGDLVRWLSDGSLEYIGRNDLQVKIRGYRIELSEIESILLLYSGITRSVVLSKAQLDLKGQPTGDKYLVCYYVSEVLLDEEKILAYLCNKLPEYMVPAFIIHITNLPLTVNGKVNLDELPEPQITGSNNYIAPTSKVEKELSKIWSEVLGLPIENIGIKDDFFKLGGNSIMAIRLLTKANKDLDYDISVDSIFKNRTIQKLASYLEDRSEINNRIEYKF